MPLPTPSHRAPSLGRCVHAFWPEKFANPHTATIVTFGAMAGNPFAVRVTQNPYDSDDGFDPASWPTPLFVYDPLPQADRDALVASGVMAWCEWPIVS